MDIETAFNWHSVLSALVFSGIGVAGLHAGFPGSDVVDPQGAHLARDQ